MSYVEIYVEACGSLFKATAVTAKASPLISLLLVNPSKQRQQLPPQKKDSGPLTPSLNNIHHKFSLLTPTLNHHLLPGAV